MAEKRNLNGAFSSMTSKQKIMAALLVLILLFVLWEVAGLFGGSAAPATQTITPVNNAAKPAGQMGASSPNSAGPAQNNMPANNPNNPAAMNQAQPQVQPQLRETTVSMDSRLLDMQKETQQKYIDQLNQLQNLKVQREIAETNQAIANARLATVTAEKNASDLLTKPAAPIPQQVPVSAYTSTLVNPTPTGVNVTGAPSEAPPAASTTTTVVSTPAELPYVVISVSMQLGRWYAVLGYQGKIFNVTVGDTLPVDGAIVGSINKNGVTLLLKNGKRKRISILSSV